MTDRKDNLTIRAFLNRLVERLPHDLHDESGVPRPRFRMTMIQIWYGNPKIHYEVWVQRQLGQIEVGLHFEADPELNGRLMRGFGPEMMAVRDELGSDFELEQWTKRWGRIHASVPFEHLTTELADQVSERLAATIASLQPRLDEMLG